MHRIDSLDGNAGSARSSRAQQLPRLLQPAGIEAGLQQCELDQIVLRAAATNAFVLSGERRQHRDCFGKVGALERSKATCQRRQIGVGR